MLVWREEDHHGVADAPHGQHGQGGFGPVLVAEPVGGGDPEELDGLVERPRGVQQEHEGDRAGHHRHQGRQVEHRPEESGARLQPGEQPRHAQPEEQLGGDHEDHQPQRVLDGDPGPGCPPKK